jgi:hypothetical protein
MDKYTVAGGQDGRKGDIVDLDVLVDCSLGHLFNSKNKLTLSEGTLRGRIVEIYPHQDGRCLVERISGTSNLSNGLENFMYELPMCELNLVSRAPNSIPFDGY